MVSYTLAAHSWPIKDVITISSVENQLIGTIPTRFLEQGGVNSWDYVLEVLSQLVSDANQGKIRAQDGSAVRLDAATKPGRYIHEPSCKWPLGCSQTLSPHSDDDPLLWRAPWFPLRSSLPIPGSWRSLTRSHSRRSTGSGMVSHYLPSA